MHSSSGLKKRGEAPQHLKGIFASLASLQQSAWLRSAEVNLDPGRLHFAFELYEVLCYLAKRGFSVFEQRILHFLLYHLKC